MRGFWIAFMAVLALASCTSLKGIQQPELGCDQIVKLQQKIGVGVSLDQLTKSINEEYGVPLDGISVTTIENKDGASASAYRVDWVDVQKLSYSAYLDHQSIAQIRVWRTGTPGDLLVACLGQPSYYYAYAQWEENGPYHRVHLVFPEHGVSAFGWGHFRTAFADPIPAINGEFLFAEFVILQPQSLEQIVSIEWGKSAPDVLDEFKPWPGGWERIEFAYTDQH